MRSRKRIAILMHSREYGRSGYSYIVDHLAEFWRQDGHDVFYLYGAETHSPADVLLVHVNVSVVPAEYLDLASSYPIVLNARITDIRKSVISSNLVGINDSWPGQVIVKSNLNYGGVPERELGGSWLDSHIPRRVRDAMRWVTGHEGFDDWTKYRLFERADVVPRTLFTRGDVVVERFLPEIEDGLYRVRVYQVLGDRWTCTRLASPQPIFKASMSVLAEPVDPHPEVVQWREQLNLDYGKLDYVVHNGRPILIDVNKTTGASSEMGNAVLSTMRRRLAEGLYFYFSG